MSALLAVRDLYVHLPTPRGTVRAVDGLSFEVMPGETVAVVGESGCGKSTLGKAIVGLQPPTAGSIEIDGVDVSGFGRRDWRPMRNWAQTIFQDPYSSLNPRKTVGQILAEPLRVLGVPAAEQTQRLVELLASVGLHRDALGRYPHEFSGGQRQRIGIARAICMNPKLIVCDEPVSALDVSVQSQIINLLVDLQQKHSLSYVFISHDLSVVQHIADRVAVMYLGKIVEFGHRKTLWAAPRHPYTRGLFDAAPDPDIDSPQREQRTVLQGEIPSPFAVPSGCCFRTRCPMATERCAAETPPLRTVAEGVAVACHFA
ncbi:MAG: ABC transporter ATP-binding protein [Burkholderiaceae bacterium]